MANKIRTIIKTFPKQADARDFMVAMNRGLGTRRDMVVMVEGPGDGEFTVMDLRSAIDEEFLYSWEI